MKIDYAEVWKTTKKVQSYFSKGRVAEITSPQDTNLVLEIGYPPLFERAGMVSKPGEFDFLPTGIASAGVKKGTANGTLVIDGSSSRIGIFREPIIITIKNRRIVKTSGGFEKREFHVLIDMFSDPNMYNVAAIFTGTNLNAKFAGVPNEDERVIGMNERSVWG
jgi:leucyl aminopeptidase (aminopeptidase T)